MSVFTDNIRYFRKLKGLSQRQLAERIGKAPPTIGAWENGISAPDPENIESLCQLLDCSPNELFGWDESINLRECNMQIAHINEKLHKLSEEKKYIDREINEYNATLAIIENHVKQKMRKENKI